jgi:hypothetical protein
MTVLSTAGGVAGAAGNRSLDRLVISNPGQGWAAVPAAQVNAALDQVGSVERIAGAREGLRVSYAAKGWSSSSSGGHVYVFLLSINNLPGRSLPVAQAARTAASAAGGSFCSGATASAPKVDAPLRSIRHSHFVLCPTPGTGASIMAVTFSAKNMFAMVAGSGTTKQQLSSIALRESRFISSGGSHSSGVAA